MEFRPVELLQESENKSWCPIPWATCSVTANGAFRLCVQANTHRDTRGIFSTPSGETSHVKNTDVIESRNQPLIKEVRKFMLEGQRHPVCQRCNNEDDNGLVSRRALSRFNYHHHTQELGPKDCSDKTATDGSIKHKDFPIKEIDLRLGNKCNLKCRSCYPGESSGWYKEWLETKGDKFKSGNDTFELKKAPSGTVSVESDKFDWMENSDFFQRLHQDAPELNYAHLVGGEPLLIKEHFSALQHFIDIGKSKDITLDYNSNVSVIPDRLISLWSQFKEIRLGYSIDGIGQVNDYIRNPSKWHDIQKNIVRLDQSLDNISMWPTVTVMAYNVFYIPEIIKWQVQSQFKSQNKSQSLMLLVHHPLHNPIELNAQVLPIEVKNKIKERFMRFSENELESLLQNKDQEIRLQMRQKWKYIEQSILNHLFKKDLSKFFPDFCKRTQQMDNYRQESIQQALPEFFDTIKDYWVKPVL